MRLIDADALLDCVQERLRYLKRKTARLSDIVAEVNTQPTIQHERTAKIIKQKQGWRDLWLCSECKKEITGDYKYCANCGAKFVEG